MPESEFPRNTTPCPACGVPTLTVKNRYGEGTVTLDVRSDLRCYQLVIHGTRDTGMATAAESMAYPEHGPLCRGTAPQEDRAAAEGRIRGLEAENMCLRQRVATLESEASQGHGRPWHEDLLAGVTGHRRASGPLAGAVLRQRLTDIIRLVHPDRWGGSHPAADEATKLLLALREAVTP